MVRRNWFARLLVLAVCISFCICAARLVKSRTPGTNVNTRHAEFQFFGKRMEQLGFIPCAEGPARMHFAPSGMESIEPAEYRWYEYTKSPQLPPLFVLIGMSRRGPTQKSEVRTVVHVSHPIGASDGEISAALKLGRDTCGLVEGWEQELRTMSDTSAVNHFQHESSESPVTTGGNAIGRFVRRR